MRNFKTLILFNVQYFTFLIVWFLKKFTFYLERCFTF